VPSPWRRKPPKSMSISSIAWQFSGRFQSASFRQKKEETACFSFVP
jgi:hypothetical protein